MGDADLTPRSAPDAPVPGRRRRWMPIVLLGLVLVAGGVIVTQFLRSAVDYYCNVDEIGVRSGCDAERRLRVQGTVDAGSIEPDGGVTRFSISFNGRTLPVEYDGQPGGIFEECQPVVVHGQLVGDVFHGDNLDVKHSDEYVEDNEDHVDPDSAAGESTTCSQRA